MQPVHRRTMRRGPLNWGAAQASDVQHACTEWLAMQKIYYLPSRTRDHTVPIVLSYVRIGRLLTTCACATAWRRCIFPLSALLRHGCSAVLPVACTTTPRLSYSLVLILRPSMLLGQMLHPCSKNAPKRLRMFTQARRTPTMLPQPRRAVEGPTPKKQRTG